MACITANWVKKTQNSSNFNATITVHRKVYHYIGAIIPPHQIEQTYASVYIHDTDEIEKAKVRETSVSQKINKGISIKLGTLITQPNPYAQAF